MLANSYAAGPETESGIMSVIAGYGGGYVTDATLSHAPGASETLTMNVVLGAGAVRNTMQGETDLGLSGIACFTITAEYYGTEDQSTAQVACPTSLTTANAQATAQRQIADQVGSEQYDAVLTAIPQSLTAAEQASRVGADEPGTTTTTPTTLLTPAATGDPTARATATAPATAPALTAADFATGTDGIQHKPDAALALPLSDGSCIYIAYRWIQTSWVGGGTAGTSDSPVARAWVTPTDAQCTGSAALTASAFLTDDHDAGG